MRRSDKIDRVEVFDTEINQWREAPPLPEGRGGLAAALWNNQIHVFGGETFSPNKVLDRHDVFDLHSETWLPPLQLPMARHGGAAVTTSTGIVLLGGGTRPGLSTVFALTPSVHLWTPPVDTSST